MLSAARRLLFWRSTPKSSVEKMAEKKSEVFLDGTVKYLTLVRKESELHNVRRLFFSLEHPDQKFGMPVASHVRFFGPKMPGKVEGEWNGVETSDEEEIFRMYSPVSDIDQTGTCELIVKVYPRDKDPKFPDGGMYSQYLDSLKIGDTVKVLGPMGYNTYHGEGRFTRMNKEIQGKKQKIGFIAAGSGLTPLYSLLTFLLTRPAEANTTISMISANIAEEDVLMKEELDSLKKKYPERFDVHYVLNNPPPGPSEFFSGFVTAEIIKKCLPPPGDDVLIAYCGSAAFKEFIKGHLESLNYAPNQYLPY